MKRNKFLTLFLIFMCGFLLVGIKSVYAVNGPSGESAYIELYRNGDDYKEIYNDGKINNSILNGVTYDKSTNTLTLNNLKSAYELIIYDMGDDFKLNLVGDNEISLIYLDAESWSTTLNIIGDGSLTINKNKKIEDPVALIDGKIFVDDTVTLKIYAPLTVDDHEDYIPSVISVRSSNTEDGYKIIKIKNGKNIVISSEQEYAIEGAEGIRGFGFRESNNPRSYTIVEKNNKKYGMYISGTNYVVTGSEIKYDAVNEEYFIDSSDNKEDAIYSNLGEVTSLGYVVKEEIVNISKEIIIGNYFIQIDEAENEYALYYADEGDIVQYLYDITDQTITLANGTTYKILKRNNDVDIDTLEPKLKKAYLDTYAHYIYLSSLEVLPDRYEFLFGANQTYIIGQDGLTFKIQAPYNLFLNGGKVYVDGKETNNFTSKEGSTIINLSKEYLSSLEEGEHTLKVLFNDGKSAITRFTVSKSSNPNTGDHILLYVLIFGVSLVGIVGLIIYLKKRK